MEDNRWTQEQRWPDGTSGPLVLRLTFALVDGRPEVVGVELWSVAPPEPADPVDRLVLDPTLAPIHTGDIRVPLRRLLDDWKASRLRAAARGAARISPGLPAGLTQDQIAQLTDQYQLTPSDIASFQAAPTGPAWLSDWAAQAVETGRIVDVKRKGRADAHGDDHWRAVAEVYLRSGLKGIQEKWFVAKGTAAKWVWVARHQKHLLPATSRGRSTGRVTGKPQGGQK